MVCLNTTDQLRQQSWLGLRLGLGLGVESVVGLQLELESGLGLSLVLGLAAVSAISADLWCLGLRPWNKGT